MLKSYLETYDPLHNHTLQKCVVKKLLSLGSHLPEWLVQSFKVCSRYSCSHNKCICKSEGWILPVHSIFISLLLDS